MVIRAGRAQSDKTATDQLQRLKGRRGPPRFPRADLMAQTTFMERVAAME
jgi:hypothetical protein